MCSYYVPEPDRDSGSRRVLDHVEFLRDSGIAVEFAALNGFRDQRYVRALARRGVVAHDATVQGFECLLGGVEFDLVVFAFWQTAERHLPAIRRISPRSRVVVDSVDLQFLRDARGTFRAEDGLLSPDYGSNLVGELNAYAAADAVLTVSAKEAATIRDLLGEATLVSPVPDAEDSDLSAIPFSGRQGILFQGSFAHTPNAGAVEFLCRKVVPLLPPELLQEHPLSIVGAGLDDTIRAYGSGNPNIRMVGWVPSVTPYLERARISVVPLLYGAGTKRKLIQSLIGGTPSVSTTVGIEGLDLVDREHVLVADEERRFAECMAQLLEDAALWRRVQRRGREAVLETHGREVVRARFLEAVAQTLARPAKTELLAESSDAAYASRMIYLENQKLVAPIRELLHTSVIPSATIAVLSNGSSELLRLQPWRTMHFPVDEAGAYAGRPDSVGDAISGLESCHERGADYLVVPSTAYWSGLYDALPTFSEELRSRYACVAQNHACTVYALGTHVPRDPDRIDAAEHLVGAVPASAAPLEPSSSVRLVALYLPQFHPIPENDDLVGRGLHRVARTSRARSPSSPATTSRTFPQSWASTISDCPRRAGAGRSRARVRDPRLLLLPLLVRREAAARAAVRRGAGVRRARLPVLPLLGERALVAPLGRPRRGRSPATGLQPERRLRAHPLASPSAGRPAGDHGRGQAALHRLPGAGPARSGAHRRNVAARGRA